MGLKLATASAGSIDINPENTASAYTFTIPAVTATALSNSSGIMNIGSGQVYKDATGGFFIGATAAYSTEKFLVSSADLTVATFRNTTNTSGYGTIKSYIQANGNNTSTYHFFANTNGVGTWYLWGNGTTTFSSDARLKKNIESTRNGYIEDLCRLRVVKYNWKNDAEGTPKEIGLIAQEVAQVFPGLVQDDISPVSNEDSTIYKQLKASVLPFMLLKAIQEQQAIITQLQADVAALKGASA